MRNLLKKYLIIILSMTYLAACSDDDPTPMNNTPVTPDSPFSLSVFDEESFVSIPNGMIQSGDAQASLAAAYVTASNGFLLFNAFFTPPAGLEPSSRKISAGNGRAAADFTVYEWTDGNGNGIAYQYSFQNGKHVVEVFIKSSGSEYLKFVQAEQSESGTEGSMKFFDVEGDTPSIVAFVYTWSVAASGVRNLVLEDTSGDLKVEINSNPDLSGNMNIYENGALSGAYNWDGLGNGSWIEYNADGSVVDQGSWTI